MQMIRRQNKKKPLARFIVNAPEAPLWNRCVLFLGFPLVL